MAEYVQKIEEMHNENSDSEDSHSAISGLDYDERNCILGATDIVLDQMVFSIPIKQVYKSIAGNGESQDEAAEKLYQSLMAMDEMIHLFYQHKGLNQAAPDEKRQIPAETFEYPLSENVCRSIYVCGRRSHRNRME